MRIAVFSTKPYDRTFLDQANQVHQHQLVYLDARLTVETAALASGFSGVCVFVNDKLDREVLQLLHANGTRLIALRSAGFNNVDLPEAERLEMTVVRVPAYSPQAVAEHAVALILSLNRMTFRAYNRVREGNFSLDGLLGFDLYGKTVGVIGTGKIGLIFAGIMRGFGCRVLAHDPFPSVDAKAFVTYVPLEQLFEEADIISLHCPLTPETHHLIDDAAIAQMKQGVMLVNTGRGRVVDTRAVIDGLKSGKIGRLGLDVYEEEENLFFQDLSQRVISDDQFMRLTTFPNVLITGHQAFFTAEALTNIAETTLANISAFEQGSGTLHRVTVDKVV
ncbi:MAG TPA: hydroxyacid dehydrogenase [Pseudomonas sp.]|jgi:D-lactate dehydrogenase|uniref:2-hydroxyacid dehydrogenase n=1 Tax=Stutzerimonas xanthomarina TaxID=271420 RepID=UPI000E7FBD67|nr:2-hydroxyacid dehydrogenase [Stutzerimonas xanthomarina]MBU0810719.1 2-hydroxyacid dehydrogenase [Gammaproteobacteria bacterium]HAQ85815.1 hydroxyacid dehydrogenase [Pseudomonas sp.]MBK3847163.1 2-hydroxyacid dehydrogenase [Stutzerimonas xanthomarina]MBU0853325.1 2-hydroxyacid dehydrogenase [Gammaproteobacteria bacterium]MBU1300062.1 2-hydroxyacid dehydrogenase [Gammaproteobacteria bacterium]|tara:strand:- start:3179 stop:4180 length:1002 start_codon:yes stop_codon:yes gene_type:complete